MADEIFGSFHGQDVRRFTLTAGGLSANILNWGGVVQDLRLHGHEALLVLGFEHCEAYFSDAAYFGAIVGRNANRIRDGRFRIGSKEYQVDPDHPEMHGLHGGSGGFSRRLWQVADHGADFLTLALRDPDGTMGFPGTLDVQGTYRLRAPATLSLELTAVCDAPTLCNLAHHSYFNLDDGGSGDILDHRLMIAADAYLLVDEALIPTGVVQPVEGTPLDFRQARKLRMIADGRQIPYDHNFCLAAGRGELRQAAWVRGATSGVEMEVWTTEPGLQLYTGQHVAPDSVGLEDRRYRAFAGLCLEPQVWPDSPNQPHFPQATLRPGEIYRQITEYRFRLT
ncbi:galactose mutarotase [Pseudaminobacter arsenicus]|uniref:Aldose 1-epimerase n=1 Tax=Borborobacter arsenicus TaxID=1851146 RepID=A0A432VBW3_9HYPH|nr:aldose epimerase family protein [Pseudaminobacter arsenicus]RUM99624.1 galactose mutarotase [Pseudaminobacter arsenicus]